MRLTVEQARKEAVDALNAIGTGKLAAKERQEACEAFVESLRYIALTDIQEAIWTAQQLAQKKD